MASATRARSIPIAWSTNSCRLPYATSVIPSLYVNGCPKIDAAGNVTLKGWPPVVSARYMASRAAGESTGSSRSTTSARAGRRGVVIRSRLRRPDTVERFLIERQQPAPGDTAVPDAIETDGRPPPLDAAHGGAAVGEHRDMLLADQDLSHVHAKGSARQIAALREVAHDGVDATV